MQVTNCSSTVLPVSAQYTALAAKATAALTFDIFLTSSAANQGLGCVVSLVNSLVSPSMQHVHRDAALRGMQGCLHILPVTRLQGNRRVMCASLCCLLSFPNGSS